MTEPKEPYYPVGRKPHRERVKEVDRLLKVGQTGSICIDNTDEHRTWYLHELAKYPSLVIESQGVLMPGVYAIKVRKLEVK